MFHAAMSSAIGDARTLARMDELARSIWQAHGSSLIGDDEAQALAEALHGRRCAIRESLAPFSIPIGRRSLFSPKRLQRAPDRQEALSRRRRLAVSGPMPPALAARFTVGQLAVLRIVGDEIAEKGVCGLCIDAIAARAGVSARWAQKTIRLAEGDGLLVIQERRHRGRKNDPSLIRIISREWQAWLKRGRRAGPERQRVNSSSPHGYRSSQSGKFRDNSSIEKLPEGSERHRWKSVPGVYAGSREHRAIS